MQSPSKPRVFYYQERKKEKERKEEGKALELNPIPPECVVSPPRVQRPPAPPLRPLQDPVGQIQVGVHVQGGGGRFRVATRLYRKGSWRNKTKLFLSLKILRIIFLKRFQNSSERILVMRICSTPHGISVSEMFHNSMVYVIDICPVLISTQLVSEPSSCTIGDSFEKIVK